MIEVLGVEVAFLHSRDADGLAAWYRDTLGLDVVYADGHWFEFATPSGSRFAIDAGSDEPSEVEQQPVMISLRVADVHAAVADLAAAGVTLYPDADRAVFRAGPSLVATFRDPDGNWMQLAQHADG